MTVVDFARSQDDSQALCIAPQTGYNKSAEVVEVSTANNNNNNTMDTGNRYEDDEEGEPLPPKVEELAQASVPSALKGVRACMRCGLIKTLDQFLEDGCDNCPFLDMAGNHERCNLCTTAFFEGQVAVMDPGESWTAKWIRVDLYLPGVYAISITGQFDREIEEELENRGCRWRCRPVGSDPNSMQ